MTHLPYDDLFLARERAAQLRNEELTRLFRLFWARMTRRAPEPADDPVAA